MSSTTLCIASIYTLCCISFDRYYAVVRPLRYKTVLTIRRTLYMLLGIWVGAVLCACVPLFTISPYQYHPGTNHCSPSWQHGCGFYVFMSIVGFSLPVLILLVTYGMIFSTIRRHAKRVSSWRTRDSKRSAAPSFTTDAVGKVSKASTKSETRGKRSAADEKSISAEDPRSRTVSFVQQPNEGRRNTLELVPYPEAATPTSPTIHIRTLWRLSQRRRGPRMSTSLPHEYKIAKTGFILVMVFFLSWGPYMVVNNCKLKEIVPLWVFRFAMWLVYFSCVLNPIVYALSSRYIRAAFSFNFNCCSRTVRKQKSRDDGGVRKGSKTVTHGKHVSVTATPGKYV